VTWTVRGLRASYVVYIDGEEKMSTTSRYGTARRPEGAKNHRKSAVGEALVVMRAHPTGKLCQIVKRYPVQAHKDHVLYTWRNVDGAWRLAPKHKELAA